jgi:hypothetical protein
MTRIQRVGSVSALKRTAPHPSPHERESDNGWMAPKPYTLNPQYMSGGWVIDCSLLIYEPET